MEKFEHLVRNATMRHEANARMHHEAAIRNLRNLADEATRTAEILEEGATPPYTIGGSFLNAQTFNDAERSLVRWWDAATAAALMVD